MRLAGATLKKTNNYIYFGNLVRRSVSAVRIVLSVTFCMLDALLELLKGGGYISLFYLSPFCCLSCSQLFTIVFLRKFDHLII